MLREGSLPFTCHMLHVMCQVSHVMCHFFFWVGFLRGKGIQWTQQNMASITEVGFFMFRQERELFSSLDVVN